MGVVDNVLERYNDGSDKAKEAFSELCQIAEAFEREREEKREVARARFEAMTRYTLRLREKHKKLRQQYIAMVLAYNALAAEAHERSDTSSSEDEERDNECCIM